MSHYPRQPHTRQHPSNQQPPAAPSLHRLHSHASDPDSALSTPAAYPFPSHGSIRLLDYVLGPVLGIGTYGEVRYAFHRPSASHLALKLLDPQRPNGGGPAQVRKAVEEEVRLMRRCESAHCIKVVEARHDVPFTGTFCSECACTSLTLPSAAAPMSGCVQCNHPAASHSVSVTRPLTLLSQELGVGGELFSILSNTGAMSAPLARFYFHQLIDAVSSMHAVNVIHRDLKPENLVFDHHFQLRVVDMGLSTTRKQPRAPLPVSAEEQLEEMDDDAMYEALTQHQQRHYQQQQHLVDQHAYEHSLSHFDEHDDGTAIHHTGVGSQPYSAPEAYYRQLYSHRPYKGAPADIWSCGVILYVMLTSRPPFNRPLTRTYGALRRDKHFVQFVKGDMDERIGEEARELLHGMLRVHADDRWGVDKIRRSRWWRGEAMERGEVERQMRERSEQTYRRMGREHMVQLLRVMRHEEGEKRRGAAPDAHTVQRSKPMPISKPTSPRSSRGAVPASYLQPLVSLSDNASSLSASASVPSQLLDDAELLSRGLSGLHVGSTPGSSPSLRDTHSSHLPSPPHERRPQRRTSPHSPPQQPAATRQPHAAATVRSTADQSPASTASLASSDDAYRTFFRSARPPSTQPLSLTAQNSLKPTAWAQQQQQQRSDRERAEDEDEEEEEEGAVDDVDAGYENDSDNTSDDLELEVEGNEAQAEVKGEEKKGGR